MAHYKEFTANSRRLADLNAALSLMNWDQEIGMPEGAAGRRAAQLGSLAEFSHDYLLHHVWPLAQELRKHPPEDPAARRNVEQAARQIEKSVKLPGEFVARMTSTTSKAQKAWEQAKKAGDFRQFQPVLAEVFALKREEASYYGYEDKPYDALVDSFDAGMTSARLREIFGPLRQELRPLLEAVQAAPPIDDSFLKQRVPKEKQLNFGRRLLELMGYDFRHGAMELSTHPFTTEFGPEDVRLTTRVDEHDLQMMMYSTVHEGGHALYEQGLPPSQYGLPGGEACSLSIHESQSRLWENNLFRSEAFLRFIFPELSTLFPDGLAGRTPADVYRAANVIRPSFIRIAADELTYHFHIMLRFEVESAIVNGEAEVKDIPELWAARLKDDLGLELGKDADGPLQDVHWSIGAVGYFPTYSLGSLYAAQLEASMRQAIPDLDAKLAAGELAPLRDWLRTNVHAKGRLYDSEEVCRQATGEPLNPAHFTAYLRQKVQTVYGLSVSPEA